MTQRLKRRSIALSSCAMALSIAAPAHSANNIQPVSGDVSPLYGRINPFYGDVSSYYGRINPFYGRINPFYGRINPFFGDVTAYWGRINPFTQTADTSTIAFYGTNYDAFWGAGPSNPYKAVGSPVPYASIAGFWQSEFSNWNAMQPAWNAAVSANDGQNLANLLQNNIINPAVAFWGQAVQKGTTAPIGTSYKPLPGVDPKKSGRTAQTLQAAEMAWLSPYGVTFKNGVIDPASLLAMDPSHRAMLMLNLYDDLMDYSGTGHVDWWMGSVGWSPALANTAGKAPAGGTMPTVGMIDFVIQSGTHLSKQITQFGSTAFNDGHGAAVGSLIMGSVDGSGVLGVMPQGSVNVVVYDPYDATGTTNWTDVGAGVAKLANAIFAGKTVPMGVLNASLGEPGYTLSPGWNDALATAGAHGHNLVIAAGNGGSTQTQNVVWNFSANPNLIIVGSVGVDGTISNFSNRPGEACLLPTAASACAEANKLKYHFIVAPGELVLVSDGLGGHMRQSGTSLAAPLVSGAIALLQNRWPWLSKYPDETATIILGTATPKGTNPGADAVYGVGELNIAASQAPLNWNNLTYYQGANGKAGTIAVPLSTVVAQLRPGTQSAWDASGLYYSAIEKIGNTIRDFQIPLSSKLVGQNVTTNAGVQQYQSYLAAALRAQAGHFSALAPTNSRDGAIVSGFMKSTVPVGLVGGATFRVSVTPAEVGGAFQMRTARYETDGALVSDGGSLNFGYGNGAAALDGSDSFGFRSDYDLGKGGANPLLGLASGGTYLGARATLVPGLSLGFGTTERSSTRNLAASGIQPAGTGNWVGRYAAQAQHISLVYAVAPGLSARAGFTRLHEDSALLGIQSLDRTDLQGGSVTSGTSVGFDLAVGHTLTVSATGTMARTHAGGGQITTRNLTSGSAELALIKARLLGKSDELRLTIASPLHTLGGHLTYNSYGVVDRDTGQLGLIAQSFAPRGRLPLAGQAMYGVALPQARGEFSLFGRVDRDSQLMASTGLDYTAGAQFRVAF